MRIAVEGCCHGELDAIYETVSCLEKENNFKIDLLLICGDFQAVRNVSDLSAMAVPPKYQQLQTFYKYYNREKKAPVLTIIIGGNHEASNYLQELTYGGWVAPNIYFLGKAGVVQVGGIRIGGVSGIYKSHDYFKGHFERPPYTENTKRSVYHLRSLEVFRMKQLKQPIDIFMSHDWPQGIYYHGDNQALVRQKPFFKKEIDDDTLGARPLRDLLTALQPSYWFSAHLHVKFAAHVLHNPGSDGQAKSTKFLALDKCLPKRKFLQVINVPHKESEGLKLKLDAEWLTVLRSTNHLLSLSTTNSYLPGPGCKERYDFTPQDKEVKETIDMFEGDLTLPENFVQTSPPLVGPANPRARRQALEVQVNPQTSLLCTMLDLTDPMAHFMGKTSEDLVEESFASTQDESDIDEDKSCLDDTAALDSTGIYSPHTSLNTSALEQSSDENLANKSLPITPLKLPAPELSTSSLTSPIVPSPSLLKLPEPQNKPPSLCSVLEDSTCLSPSSDSSISPSALKRKSPELLSGVMTSTPVSNPGQIVGSAGKKLKRRNVSIYSESQADIA